jgi:hypothetical protein
MTPDTEAAIPRRMGRKKRWHEALLVKFPAGTRERIDAVLRGVDGRTEDRTDFVRTAVERELVRREAGKPLRRERRS